MSAAPDFSPEVVKRCCAIAYEGDWVRLLLGDSFHPGGPMLTRRLADAMALSPGERVIDVASGTGSTAVLLAREFGVTVEGFDLSERSIQAGQRRAEEEGIGEVVRFRVGDAERLPAADDSFDAAVCECSLCLFPDKKTAIGELARVLRPGGRVGITDVVAAPEKLPEELRGFAARLACVADARPLVGYTALLRDAGLRVTNAETHDRALEDLIDRVDSRLAAIDMLGLPIVTSFDFDDARRLLRVASQAVRDGTIGYALLVAWKP